MCDVDSWSELCKPPRLSSCVVRRLGAPRSRSVPCPVRLRRRLGGGYNVKIPKIAYLPTYELDKPYLQTPEPQSPRALELRVRSRTCTTCRHACAGPYAPGQEDNPRKTGHADSHRNI